MPIMSRALLATGLLAASLLLGALLRRRGRPLSADILSAHKLLALGAAGLLGTAFYRAHQVEPLAGLRFALAAICGLFWALAVATGALLARPTPPPRAVLWAHRGATLLTVGAWALALYALLAA